MLCQILRYCCKKCEKENALKLYWMWISLKCKKKKNIYVDSTTMSRKKENGWNFNFKQIYFDINNINSDIFLIMLYYFEMINYNI